MEQNRKRIIGGALFLGALTLLLCARLFYIQILCHAELAAAARAQYETALVGIDDRGQIFDRNLRPLTGGKYRYYYIISKETCKAAAAGGQLNTLLAEIGAERITLRSARYEVYRAEIFDAAVHRQLQEQFGAYAFRGRTRYQSSQSACHLIGYLNEDEQRGVSGLELLCEETLQAKGSKLILESDAAGRLLFGIAPQKVKAAGSSAANARTNDADGAANAGNAAIGQGNIVTTLDLRVQQKCEALLARLCGAEGEPAKADAAAVLVSCADSGELLAAASYPTFEPEHIADYLAADCEDNGCLLNRTLQAAYPPGSVFKLVVAAAALENDICDPSQCFTCCGSAEVAGITLSCSTGGETGHSRLNMQEAMAASCNCYFAQLGELVGYEKVLETARQLGFGETVLENFPGEAAGHVPSDAACGIWDTANLSIGQGALLVTPLQVHRLTETIACGGLQCDMKLLRTDAAGSAQASTVCTVSYDTAGQPADVPRSQSRRVLKPETAAALQQMMAAVVREGTAAHLAWEMPAWGKSGTAEASRGGVPVKQCWFTGFCESADGTRYVITVLGENGRSGSSAALPVFHELAGYLTELQP
mgnify:FL=1